MLVLAVLLGGAAATWVVAAQVDRIEQRQGAQTMDRYTDDVSRAIDDEVQQFTATADSSGKIAG